MQTTIVSIYTGNTTEYWLFTVHPCLSWRTSRDCSPRRLTIREYSTKYSGIFRNRLPPTRNSEDRARPMGSGLDTESIRSLPGHAILTFTEDRTLSLKTF